jgi:hypothetical protein
MDVIVKEFEGRWSSWHAVVGLMDFGVRYYSHQLMQK